jgi:hypothetical protein
LSFPATAEKTNGRVGSVKMARADIDQITSLACRKFGPGTGLLTFSALAFIVETPVIAKYSRAPAMIDTSRTQT